MYMLPFWTWYTGYTPVVPKFYWDVKSPEQRIKDMCKLLNSLIDYVDAQSDQININIKDIQELKDLFNKFKEHGFDDYYKEQVIKWIKDNINLLYTELTSQVFFGLTDDGYFCAYVPQSWREIVFDTGMVWGRADYGRLILRYDAEGTGVINNTYSYALTGASRQNIADLQGDVEYLTKVLFTNLDELVEGGK